MRNSTNSAMQDNFKSFSTKNIPHHERLEYWEAHNAEALIGLDIRPLHAQALVAQQYNRESPTTRLAKVRGSSQLIERSPEMIRKYPTESVALFFCTQGDSFYSDENGSHVLQAGQMLACDADTTFVRGFGVGVSEMVMTVHMDAFLKISGGRTLKQAEKFIFGHATDHRPPSAAARQIAQWVDQALAVSDQECINTTDTHLTLLEMLFQSSGNDSGQLYEQAQHFMNMHLENPDFRRADIANMLHMSERQVARLFAANDTSFSRELLSKRIQAAEHLLTTERHTPIADIARRCGFGSTAYFSRTFRQMVGSSPSEARRNSPDTRGPMQPDTNMMNEPLR